MQTWIIHPSFDVIVVAASHHQRDITNNNKDRSIFLRAVQHSLLVQSKSSPAPPPVLYEYYIPSSIIIRIDPHCRAITARMELYADPPFFRISGTAGRPSLRQWRGGSLDNCRWASLVLTSINPLGASSAALGWTMPPGHVSSYPPTQTGIL